MFEENGATSAMVENIVENVSYFPVFKDEKMQLTRDALFEDQIESRQLLVNFNACQSKTTTLVGIASALFAIDESNGIPSSLSTQEFSMYLEPIMISKTPSFIVKALELLEPNGFGSYDRSELKVAHDGLTFR